jgi:hypothetical protein
MTIIEREVRAEQELSEALEAFIGQWVAVKNHLVVAHADTLRELLAHIETTDLDVEGVFQVIKEQGSASFF